MMGLLDSIVGAIKGNTNPQQIISIVSHLLDESGGAKGLLDKFKQNGFEEVVSSWMGDGEKKPISSDDIQSVLGSDVILKIASSIGLNGQQVSSLLSKYLPDIVNHLSKGGSSDQWDLSQLGGDWLKSLLSK